MQDKAVLDASPEVEWLREVGGAITSMPRASSDVDRIDRIRQFEILKSVLAAAQLSEAVQFDASQRLEQAVAGVKPEQQGRGAAAQLGLATHQSPWHARRWLGWGKVLTSELPVTFTQLRSGATTERRALLVAQETVWLSREDRAEVDSLVGPRLPELGDRRVENEARAHAQRLDPAGAADRRRVAERERRVTLRPRPDTMSSLTATDTVERGVEMWARLRRDADALVGTGQAGGRTRDQVMADLHYERITGRDAAAGPGIDVEVIITTETLLGTDKAETEAAEPNTAEPDIAETSDPDERVARLADYLARFDDSENDSEKDSENAGETAGDEAALITADGITPVPITASIARQLIANAPEASIRRLFVSPDCSQLLAMESRSRKFPEGLRNFIRFRDQYCSTPYCCAPIRHADHGDPAGTGGPTNEPNGNGKCAACNLAKQAPGWRQDMTGHGRGTLITPTGHRYALRPPRLPGPLRATDYTPIVDYFWQAIHAS